MAAPPSREGALPNAWRSGRSACSAKKRSVGRSARIAPAVEIDHPGGQALGLAEVVRAHDERHSVGGESGQHSLDLLLRRRVEIGGRLVEEQHVGPDRPGAGQGQPLLLAAREGARRPLGAVGQAGALQRLARPARPAPAAGTPASQRAMRRLFAHRQAEHERALEHHRLGDAAGADAARAAVRQRGRAGHGAGWSCRRRCCRPGRRTRRAGSARRPRVSAASAP